MSNVEYIMHVPVRDHRNGVRKGPWENLLKRQNRVLTAVKTSVQEPNPQGLNRQICVAAGHGQSRFLLQWVVVNRETHNCLK